jgi:glucose/arabinose dehydrogenase
LITGIAFAPGSNASNMTMWISSGDLAESNAPDFTGTIGAIQISNGVVGPYQVYVTGLPRSNSNHLNNQPVFGPDGALYWGEGSNTSMGAPDAVWGNRPEHLLNAAILRLNIQQVQQYVTANKQPLNVQTDSLPAGQTAYNPYATGAPLTIYATGVRNAYDLIWDTNGHLYAPTNGAAAGGNIPATPAGVTPSAPAINGVSSAEDDYLYDIVPGGYYGHPDPARGQYIFGGGNPISPQADWAIQDAYPLGTNPDPNYKGYAFDFGPHYSPDGAIEYTGNAFGGALNGALLITEYSGGKDVVVLRTGGSGQITGEESGIAGFTGFSDPVDIAENPANGDLYVADLGTDSISLLTPISGGATISASVKSVGFNAAPNGPVTAAQTVTITNTGTQPLAIGAGGLLITGSNGAMFPIANKPALPAIIAAGSSITVGIAFNPGSASTGTYTASLVIASNDQVTPILTIALSAVVKTVPPAMPTAVQAVGGTGGITVSWTASTTTPIRGYLVYRSTNSKSGYALISNGAFAGTTYLDTTAMPGVRYYYSLTTDDETGTISPFTIGVSAVVPVTPSAI